MDMNVKSAAVFCPDCGRIMDPPTDSTSDAKCQGCHKLCPWEFFIGRTTVTKSKTKFSVAALLEEGEVDDSRATVKENCPKCAHTEAKYATLQMRSSDEGQTVFYECTKCTHVWSVNS